jgi:hypothetical protein
VGSLCRARAALVAITLREPGPRPVLLAEGVAALRRPRSISMQHPRAVADDGSMTPALTSVPHALEAAPPDHKARPADLRPAVAEGVAALARLVTHPGRGWAAELTRARGAVWHALRVLAVAERHAVELHHAARVRLPPGAETRAEVAALALLEVALAGRDVRPAMVRRLGRVLRRLVGPPRRS